LPRAVTCLPQLRTANTRRARRARASRAALRMN